MDIHNNTPNEPKPQYEVNELGEAGIVSVNNRGATSDGMGKKIAFIGVICALLALGGLYGFNKYRALKKADAAATEKDGKLENKPAAVSQKRSFEEEAKGGAAGGVKPVDGVAGVNDKTNGAGKDCKAVTILSPNGQPMIGSNGLPVRVGCDGKIVVPAPDSKYAPTANNQANNVNNNGRGVNNGGGNNNAAHAIIPKPASRYAGDVILKAPMTLAGGAGVSNASNNPAQQLAMLQSLLSPKPAPATGNSPFSLPGMNAANAASDTPTGTGSASSQGNVGALLSPTATPTVTASKLGDRNLLLAKGAQIDCSMHTKLVNEVSGFANCVLTSNVYSDNGKAVLLERGSEVTGEYGAMIQQGQRRIFVLWTRVKTPAGVVISLGSPAADGLGTMGLDGHVDNRWFDRIGAAFLLSFVKDAITYETAKSSAGAVGSATYANSTKTTESMAEKILASTINIKPTIYKNQGDRASIYVARDLDFSTVYALKAN